MKRHEDALTKEVWYEDVLENGMHVEIVHKPLFVTSSCFFAVGYGSLDHIQTDENGNVYRFPSGTAHYLEHKLFESDHGDVMADFSAMGASVNAYTSYEETGYFFDTPNEIERPLNLLLDFVQQLHLSDESVEREKGIILEERRMYQQDPDSRLLLETMRSMYKSHPLNEDIVGSEADIQGMKRSDLEQAYSLNYHPSRTVLAVTTPEDPEYVMEIIRKNQKGKQFDTPHHLQRFDYREPLSVVRDQYDLSMDVSLCRAMVGIKLNVPHESSSERLRREWAVRMMLESWFSSSNPLYQVWIDEKKITPVFTYEEDLNKDSGMLLFEDETEDPKAFEAFVTEQLSHLKKTVPSSELFEQLKRRYIGTLIHIFNDPASVSEAMAKGMLDDVSLFDELKLVQNLSPQSCLDLFNENDLSNVTCTYLHPLEQ